jgi:hypothetical protein
MAESSESSQKAAAGKEAAPLSRRRTIASWTLVGVATFLLLIASFTLWSKRQLLDTDAYASTSAKMLQNEDMRSALSLYMVNTLYSNVDVAELLRERLPQQVEAIAPIAAAGLRQLSLRAANQLLASPQVQSLWEQANRLAHSRLIAVLDGETTRIGTAQGKVVLDLRPLVERLESSGGIGERVAAKLPPDAGKITILTSKQLKTAQTGLKVFRALTVFLVLAALACYALAIYLPHGRRRKYLIASAASFIFVGLLILVLGRLVGNAIVNSLAHADAAKPAAHAAWTIGTSLLREMAIALVIYGVVGFVGAWLAGPTRWARAVRRFMTPSFRDSPGIVFGVVGVAYLLVVWWGPTPALQRWWGILLLGGLLFLGVEMLRRQMVEESPQPATS